MATVAGRYTRLFLRPCCISVSRPYDVVAARLYTWLWWLHERERKWERRELGTSSGKFATASPYTVGGTFRPGFRFAQSREAVAPALLVEKYYGPEGVGSRNHRSDVMPTGTVKWFNSQKGYGFIRPDDGSMSSCTYQRWSVRGFTSLRTARR